MDINSLFVSTLDKLLVATSMQKFQFYQMFPKGLVSSVMFSHAKAHLIYEVLASMVGVM